MRPAIVLLTSLALSACTANEHQDLNQWMKEAGQDSVRKIPALPEVKAYEPISYDAANLTDPFKIGKIEPEQKKSGSGLQPDQNRTKEPLESYPLGSLKYVGLLLRNKIGYALIQAEEALFQVKVGNYLGQDFGLITKISDDSISLRELVQDASGDWVERESALSLQEKEPQK
ncbi:MAG: pilus assembly protein PilP [Pseudomonadota bacterium]